MSNMEHLPGASISGFYLWSQPYPGSSIYFEDANLPSAKVLVLGSAQAWVVVPPRDCKGFDSLCRKALKVKGKFRYERTNITQMTQWPSLAAWSMIEGLGSPTRC